MATRCAHRPPQRGSTTTDTRTHSGPANTAGRHLWRRRTCLWGKWARGGVSSPLHGARLPRYERTNDETSMERGRCEQKPTGTQGSEYPLIVGGQDKVVTVVLYTNIPDLERRAVGICGSKMNVNDRLTTAHRTSAGKGVGPIRLRSPSGYCHCQPTASRVAYETLTTPGRANSSRSSYLISHGVKHTIKSGR